jgi:hypothetical protein
MNMFFVRLFQVFKKNIQTRAIAISGGISSKVKYYTRR